MGLTGFQRVRRQAAERSGLSAEGMTYETAIAILSQPLLEATSPALEKVPNSTPDITTITEPAAIKPVRKRTKTKASQEN